jgi:hypothetical protein
MFTEQNYSLRSTFSEFTQKIFQKIDYQMSKGPGSKLNKKSKFLKCFTNFDLENMRNLPQLKVILFNKKFLIHLCLSEIELLINFCFIKNNPQMKLYEDFIQVVNKKIANFKSKIQQKNSIIQNFKKKSLFFERVSFKLEI